MSNSKLCGFDSMYWSQRDCDGVLNINFNAENTHELCGVSCRVLSSSDPMLARKVPSSHTKRKVLGAWCIPVHYGTVYLVSESHNYSQAMNK